MIFLLVFVAVFGQLGRPEKKLKFRIVLGGRRRPQLRRDFTWDRGMYDFPPFLVGHTPEVRPAMVCPGHGRPQMMVSALLVH